MESRSVWVHTFMCVQGRAWVLCAQGAPRQQLSLLCVVGDVIKVPSVSLGIGRSSSGAQAHRGVAIRLAVIGRLVYAC